MKERLDTTSLDNFVAAARGAVERSGSRLEDVSYVCGIHMKRSMHAALLDALGVAPDRAAYLDDTGHMSGVDPAARPRPCRAGGKARRRRPRPAPRRRYRLHMGRERRTLGTGMNVGDEYGPSEWLEIDQERIDRFAEATGDDQWIHVDPARAAEGPFGTTIAHGFLTLSLLVRFLYEVRPESGEFRMGINYGVNRVRFPAPVPVGSRIRGRFRIVDGDGRRGRHPGDDRGNGRARGPGEARLRRRDGLPPLPLSASGSRSSRALRAGSAPRSPRGWKRTDGRCTRSTSPTATSRREGERAVVDAALERFGRLDAVVANAGFQHVAPIAEFPEERWDPCRPAPDEPVPARKYAWEALSASGEGRFVAIASEHGLSLAVKAAWRLIEPELRFGAVSFLCGPRAAPYTGYRWRYLAGGRVGARWGAGQARAQLARLALADLVEDRLQHAAGGEDVLAGEQRGRPGRFARRSPRGSPGAGGRSARTGGRCPARPPRRRA